MRAHPRRSRAHRTLLFEYLLGLSMVGLGLLGMTAMQARLLLIQHAGVSDQRLFGLWLDRSEYPADDPRSLSESLRVCGDGLDRPIEMDCWRDQLGALLPARPTVAATANGPWTVSVLGEPRRVSVYGTGDGDGGGIVVADAATGLPLWRAQRAATAGYDADAGRFGHPDLVDPVAAAVTAFDSNHDGLVDRLYAGDEGGRLWRVDLRAPPLADMSPDDPAGWQLTTLLSAGRHTASAEPGSMYDRRFRASPDVVQAADSRGRYDAVLIGSTAESGAPVDNWFYVVKDRAVESGEPATQRLEHAQLPDLSTRCPEADCGAEDSPPRGWRVRLGGGGERFTGQAVTAAGNVFFTTYESVGRDCSGRRVLYVLGLRDARPVARVDSTLSRDQAANEVIDIVERAAGFQPCRLASLSS